MTPELKEAALTLPVNPEEYNTQDDESILTPQGRKKDDDDYDS